MAEHEFPTLAKCESPARQSHFFFSEMTAPSVRELDGCLWKTGLACQDLRETIRRWGDENGYLSTEQHERNTALEDEVAHLRRENAAAQAELHERRTNYDLVIGDVMRLCDEKQTLIKERDSAQFQKAVSDLMVDQYRDETTEQREVIGARDAEIRDLAHTCASLDAEVSSLRSTLKHRNAADLRSEDESRSLLEPKAAGVQDLAVEPPTAAQLEKARRKRKRKGRRDRRRGKAGKRRAAMEWAT